MIRIKYYLQKLFGLFLDKPIFMKGRVTGYSLVKSVKSNVRFADHTNVAVPFYLNNVSLGEYSYVARNCSITNTAIGRFCSIGPNFSCGLGIHPVKGISTAPMFYSTAKQNGVTLAEDNKIDEFRQTTIGNDVFIGANVTVLDGVSIENGAVIGAGAVVTKNIPPYAIAVGVPAKVVNYRFSKAQICELQKLEWWNFHRERLQEIEKNFFEIDKFLDLNK
jgi:acetyltransferase-like isoleucine patch superfamily enzyme